MVTFILLNWKRPDNLHKVIESIKNQTIETKILVWNNGDRDIRFDCDMQIDSSTNLVCYPRWLMGSFVNTKYVATMDDDICFSSNNILEEEIKMFEIHDCDDLIIGPYGRICKSSYTDGYDVINKSDKVDVIKGRHMLLKTSLLTGLDLLYEPDCEDIKISSLSNTKIVFDNFNGFINLKEGDEALWKRSTHFTNRNIAFKKYFKR